MELKYEKQIITEFVKGKVLDLGCGDGRLYNLLSKNASYIGIDVAETSIKQAQLNYPLGEFIIMDASKLDFLDKTFNIVFCGFNALSEVWDLDKVLLEIKRVLKRKGLLIFSFQNRLYYKHLLRTYEKNGIRFKPLSSKEVINLYGKYFNYIKHYGNFYEKYPYYIFSNRK